MSAELQFVLALCAIVGTYYQRSTRDEIRALRGEIEDLTDPDDGTIAEHHRRLTALEQIAGIEEVS